MLGGEVSGAGDAATELGTLATMATTAKRRKRELDLFIEDCAQREAEYRGLHRRAQTVLAAVGMGADRLSAATSERAAALAKIASSLETGIEAPEIVAGVARLRSAIASRENELARLVAENDEIRSIAESAHGAHKQSERLLAGLRRGAPARAEMQTVRAEQSAFYWQKARAYRREVEQLEAELKAVGFTHELRHDMLVSGAREVDRLQDELRGLRESLGRFHGLVRSPRRAGRQLAAKNRELTSITSDGGSAKAVGAR